MYLDYFKTHLVTHLNAVEGVTHFEVSSMSGKNKINKAKDASSSRSFQTMLSKQRQSSYIENSFLWVRAK